MSSEDNVVTAGCEEKKTIPLIILAGDQLKSPTCAHTHIADPCCCSQIKETINPWTGF